jgi:hypothetical protein
LARIRIARLAHKMAATANGGQAQPIPLELIGALPAREESGIILAACNIHYYWRFAITLVLSMERHAVPQRMHLHLCEPDRGTLRHVDRLSRQLGHVRLSWTADDGKLAQAVPSRDVYYSAARFLVAPQVLQATKAPLLCIDADAIAMKPIWPEFEAARQDADILLFQQRSKVVRKVFPGAVGINPTPEGLRFAKTLARSLAAVLATSPTDHFDQLTLRYLLSGLERRSAIAVKHMPLSLMDYRFNDGSAVWMPKGQGGKSAEAYHRARQEIVGLFPNIERKRPEPSEARPVGAEGLTDSDGQPQTAPEPKTALPSPRLVRVVERHGRWVDQLELRNRPWLILGSAPDPTIPPEIAATHARIDINNAGRTAAAMGLGRADLTIRAKKKSWEEHRHVDTRGLIWLHSKPAFLLRLFLLTKRYDHIGSVIELTRPDRDAIVTHVAGTSVQSIGDLGKVTNGIAAACYGLLLGVPQIVLAGISLSKVGHSYDDLGRRRRQVDEDAFILDRLKDDPRLFTTEGDLASDTGIRLLGKADRLPPLRARFSNV